MRNSGKVWTVALVAGVPLAALALAFSDPTDPVTAQDSPAYNHISSFSESAMMERVWSDEDGFAVEGLRRCPDCGGVLRSTAPDAVPLPQSDASGETATDLGDVNLSVGATALLAMDLALMGEPLLLMSRGTPHTADTGCSAGSLCTTGNCSDTAGCTTPAGCSSGQICTGRDVCSSGANCTTGGCTRGQACTTGVVCHRK